MHTSEDYENARGRAEAKYHFIVHAIVFTAVIGLLVMINLINWDGVFWAIWPLLGWGLALGIHAARVFLGSSRNTIIDALTERELDTSKRSSRPDHT